MTQKHLSHPRGAGINMIQGLSHITFVVLDLAKTKRLIEFVLDGREVYCSGDKFSPVEKTKFFLVGGVWIAIMEGPSLPERTYCHVAFKIEEKDLPLYQERITALGLEVKPSRPRVEGEGQSLYFYDWDNHMFELHTGTLEERLKRYSANV